MAKVLAGMNHKIQDYTFIKELALLPFVDEIWLFGSRARGDYSERSDIDLAIVCPSATDKNWDDVLKVVENADTLLKIDCIRFDENRMSKEFYENIIKDRKVLYMTELPLKDIPWQDYFDTLGRAVSRLQEVMEHPDVNTNDYMRDAAIQRFEFTIELSWKMLKKILYHEKVETTTPRDTLSKAYQYTLIDDEDIWLRMLDDRNNTSHAYKEEEAKRIFDNIKGYVPVFVATYERLKKKYDL